MIKSDDICDSCDSEPADLELGALKLCSACYTAEKMARELAKPFLERDSTVAPIQWDGENPVDKNAGVGVIKIEQAITNSDQRKLLTIPPEQTNSESGPILASSDGNKYQEFFNQTVKKIADLTPDEIREFILQTQEELFSVEAEQFRLKVKKQAAKITFNNLIKNLNSDEQERLRLEDKEYTPRPRVLKNPLDDKAKKAKKVKGIEAGLAALGMTEEQIAEFKKKQGIK